MSNPDEQPDALPDACRASGRHRAAPSRARTRSRRARSRDKCPTRRRLLDPEHEAFVDWFVAYWRRHGAQLLASDTADKEA